MSDLSGKLYTSNNEIRKNCAFAICEAYPDWEVIDTFNIRCMICYGSIRSSQGKFDHNALSRHHQTKKHVQAKENIDSLQENPFIKKRRMDVNVSWCTFLLEQGIPFGHSDNIISYILDNFSDINELRGLAQGDTLRRNYVSQAQSNHKENIKVSFDDTASRFGYTVTADETTDTNGDCPIVLLVQPHKKNQFPKPILLDIVYQDEFSSDDRGTNNVDIQQTIYETLCDYNIPLRSMKAVTFDGAGYMTTAYEKLKNQYSMLIFIWCFCHMLDRLFNLIYNLPAFNQVKMFMQRIRKLFKNSNIRKKKWKTYALSQGKSIKQLAIYVITRWGSWITSVDEILDYLTVLPEFLLELREFYEKKSLSQRKVAVESIDALLSDLDNVFTLKMKMYFLKDLHIIKNYITTFETNEPQIHLTSRRMTELRNHFSLGAQHRLNLNSYMLDEIELLADDEQSNQRNWWWHWSSEIYSELLRKFNKLLQKQPNYEFIETCRFFDPSLVKEELPDQLSDIIDFIPFFSTRNNLADRDIEYCVIYEMEIERQYQIYRTQEPSSIEIIQYWENFEDEWPDLFRLAMMCLSILVSSACAERCFSFYTTVLKRRPNATRLLLKTLTILRHNK